jgi:hypothetical protein
VTTTHLNGRSHCLQHEMSALYYLHDLHEWRLQQVIAALWFDLHARLSGSHFHFIIHAFIDATESY